MDEGSIGSELLLRPVWLLVVTTWISNILDTELLEAGAAREKSIVSCGMLLSTERLLKGAARVRFGLVKGVAGAPQTRLQGTLSFLPGAPIPNMPPSGVC